MRAEPRRVQGPGWKGRVVLGMLGVLMALGAGEVALRATHFHFDLVPALQFGWPDPQTLRDAYESDADLIWVPHDYRATLRAARTSHPSIVFMGDSCTEFGSYPARVLSKLPHTAGATANGIKLGVGGWSTEQGLQQLRRDVIPMHPAVIVVYYGWNDHWVAMGLTDPEITRVRGLRTAGTHLRLAQLWLKLKVNAAAHRSPAPNRVPIAAYESNLRHIASEAKAVSIVPVFITAPSNHAAGHEPSYLAQRHLRQLSELIPLHDAYANATRAVARDTASPLCDAAAAFASMPGPHDGLFQRDGIHLTPAGDELMARIVVECLTPLGTWR
jgi:lysophospholipase L1-like esterase